MEKKPVEFVRETMTATYSEVNELIAQIRAAREKTLRSLIAVSEADFPLPTNMQRWTEVRRVLLRFGDHLREHANQIEHTRALLDRAPTMPQRMLQEAELAYGKLAAALVGLSDEDLNAAPPDGGWSVRQVLEHALESEINYLAVVLAALNTEPGAGPEEV
jgi:acyl-CoA reductase-like NAD-dependent aldehyde dehydrogenase